jgi:phosphoribosylglycinamide formyltransferase-1
VTSRIVVLASGSGTLMQALIDAQADPRIPYRIVGLVSDRADAVAIQRAERADIASVVVSPSDDVDRDSWNVRLTDAVGEFAPDWIVCAGFMRILGEPMLGRFAGRIVNSHPALLPAFAGAHGVRDALAYGVRVTGCTLHLVDAGVDTGPILAQECVPVRPDDDEATVHERIKTIERRLLVDVVSDLCRYGCTVTGRKVTIP